MQFLFDMVNSPWFFLGWLLGMSIIWYWQDEEENVMSSRMAFALWLVGNAIVIQLSIGG